MVELINLTPHNIIVIRDGQYILEIHASGEVARCSVVREKVAELEFKGFRIPLNKVTFGDVEGLPEPKDDTLYIVSSMVAQACPDRLDLLTVDDEIRNDKGKIIGCRALGIRR